MKSNDVEVKAAYRCDGDLRMTGHRLLMKNYGVQAQAKIHEGWTRPRRQMGIISTAFGLVVSGGERVWKKFEQNNGMSVDEHVAEERFPMCMARAAHEV